MTHGPWPCRIINIKTQGGRRQESVAAGQELRHLRSTLPEEPSLTQLAIFSMMSCAERASAGGAYRSNKRDEAKAGKRKAQAAKARE